MTRRVTFPINCERGIKVGEKDYDRVKALARARGQSMREVMARVIAAYWDSAEDLTRRR